MNTKILTPENPQWMTFLGMLAGAHCAHGCQHDYRHSEKIMTDIGGIDIPESIAFFQKHGGFCDCEVGLNVQDNWEEYGDRRA
jgi:Protein of unknown function (DUF2695)